MLIYTNGGFKIGLGHVMRTLLLASKIQNSFNIQFVSLNNDDFISGHKLIEDSLFKLILIDGTKNLFAIKSDYLLCDDCMVDEEFFKDCKKYFKKIICIDDECVLKYYNVDVLINPNPYAKELAYKVNTATKFLFNYKFLRDEFYTKKPIKIRKNINNILLTLGGSDDKNLTYEIICSILPFIEKHNINLNVVLGGAFKYKTELLKIQHSKLIFFENPVMSDLMMKNDMGICACGQTVYEFLFLKIPIIGLVLSEDQKRLAEYGRDRRLFYYAKSIKDINLFLENSNYNNRLSMQQRMKTYKNYNKLETIANELF
ncbi:hypothetical protein [Campylobacter sp. CNRCH_2014_0184h]|uniref:hypothetical protein n=1 Tax=Campylobacter sp. CNRCH_2014_0184h TaxID=2911602 RepID=UPI0021E6C84E|nr:hypothetical protein [Campylobacter sp. CNRCH_2014_0184h]MCV3482456.1 hypothetical protein [Campylobacter sp. CNRCH_2014_0184h]